MESTTQNTNGRAPINDEEQGMGNEEENIAAEIEQDALVKELEEAQKQIAAFQDKIIRMQAEMENLRKRTERDLSNAHKYGIEKFAGELLQVKDSLELGLTANADVSKLQEGTELTLKMLASVLKKFAVEEIDPWGESFDPNMHEAMTIQESTEQPPNTVISVMQKGYTLNDRLLRPAMVIVSKSPSGSSED